jgi:ubiquinone/menaquinone biosynthesis C-methylase UbiE
MNFGNDNKTALQAKFDAQKIAFGPIMFQAARSLQKLGILQSIKKSRNKGIRIVDIANELKLSVYGVKVLIEAGLSMELVRVEDDKFFLTKTGFFLLSDPLTQVNMNFVHDVNYKGFLSLEESIRTGKPEGLKVFGDWDTVYEALSQLPVNVQESWFEFDHFYSDNAFPEVLPIIFENKPEKLLDVGGNTGKWAILCGKYNEEIEVTILDLPGQLEKAYKNIDANNLADRIKGVPINLLDHSISFPTGFDIVWMSQFLDCFSQEDILELLKRAKKAIHSDGVVYILETFWDKQKYEASTYSLHATSLYFTCLANGCSQMYHSEDMLALIEKAGLYLDKEFHNIGISHSLYQCKINNPDNGNLQ